MARRGRKREVGRGTSRSSQVRVVPLWQTPISRRELAKALAMYLLWRIEQTPEATTEADGPAGPEATGGAGTPAPDDGGAG